MGLGKTLTMISLILHSKENNLNDPEENVENDEEWSGKSNGKRNYNCLTKNVCCCNMNLQSTIVYFQ